MQYVCYGLKYANSIFSYFYSVVCFVLKLIQFKPWFYLTGGSVFSSPKILTGAGNNPFAVRSSPGRVSNENNSGDTLNNSSASIIAPSKFGAAASTPYNSSNSVQAVGLSGSSSTSHSLKESHGKNILMSCNKNDIKNICNFLDASDCNGSSSKPVLRPSLIGTGSSFTSSGTSQSHSILKPATLGNPFSRAVDLPIEDSPTTAAQQSGSRRHSGTDANESKSTLLIPSRLNNVSAIGSSQTAPAAAGEGSDEASELATIPDSSDTAAAESVIPSAVQRPSLTSASLFSTTVTSVPSVGNPAPPTPTACANFVFGQKLHERVAVRILFLSTCWNLKIIISFFCRTPITPPQNQHQMALNLIPIYLPLFLR